MFHIRCGRDTTFVREPIIRLCGDSPGLTSIEWRETIKGAAPVLLGVVSLIGGLGLMRVSAIFENWFLLFVSFALLVWGTILVFTGNDRAHGETWPAEQ